MFENKEETQKIAWYVTIYLNGLTRTYNFRSDKERDWLYEFLKDRTLRNQAVEINDCQEEEQTFIPPRFIIKKGKTPSNLDSDLGIDGLGDLKFHKKDEIVLSVLGARG